ncbi:MAG: FmdB family zinc ribbon protein [Rhodospirillaceae bacterium]|nr:FmdB family zinc ribbon protein [Rhodospirillaceae bacterium]
MPIYAYRCAACGHAKDVLQKLADAPLTDCPACGAPRFEKQVTAAGFQLKGSGWYVTDFRDGQGKKGEAKGADKAAAPAPASASGDAATPAPTAAPAAPAPAAAPAPSTDSSS